MLMKLTAWEIIITFLSAAYNTLIYNSAAVLIIKYNANTCNDECLRSWKILKNTIGVVMKKLIRGEVLRARNKNKYDITFCSSYL